MQDENHHETWTNQMEIMGEGEGLGQSFIASGPGVATALDLSGTAQAYLPVVADTRLQPWFAAQELPTSSSAYPSAYSQDTIFIGNEVTFVSQDQQPPGSFSNAATNLGANPWAAGNNFIAGNNSVNGAPQYLPTQQFVASLPSHGRGHRARRNRIQCTRSGCTKTFSRPADRDRHVVTVHDNVRFHCLIPGCPMGQGQDNGYCRLDKLKAHLKKAHANQGF